MSITGATPVWEILLQIGFLFGLGVLATLLVRVLRFRPVDQTLPHPLAAAIWAVVAVSLGWLLITVIHFAGSGDETAGPPSTTAVALPGPGDVFGQLILALILICPVLIIMRRRKKRLLTDTDQSLSWLCDDAHSEYRRSRDHAHVHKLVELVSRSKNLIEGGA